MKTTITNIIYERTYGKRSWVIRKNSDGKFIGLELFYGKIDDVPAVFSNFKEAKQWADAQWEYQ